MITQEHNKFIKLFNSLSYRSSNYELFYDYCTMTAYTMALPFYGNVVAEKLKSCFSKYKPEQILVFDKMTEVLVDSLEREHQDFLGIIFETLEISNKNTGQFFTPYQISVMLARMQMQNFKDVKKDLFWEVGEPACGSGGMIVALREALIENGLNPSKDIFVYATDVSHLAFLMSYIQIGLYGIGAQISHGNTITMETWERMFTPVYFLENWDLRLAFKRMTESIHQYEESKHVKYIPIEGKLTVKNVQGNLFTESI